MPLRQYDPQMGLIGSDPRQWEKIATAATFSSAAVFAAIWLTAPSMLVLPIFSAVSLLIGFGLAAVAWSLALRRHLQCVTCWDVSGTYLVVGFVAGVLSEHEHVATFVAAGAQ